MNRFSFPIKDQPLTEERLRQAASYMANLIIAYDFEYITHHVPDVRNMVEYLEEHIYRALTQVEWRVQLKEYFEDFETFPSRTPKIIRCLTRPSLCWKTCARFIRKREQSKNDNNL